MRPFYLALLAAILLLNAFAEDSHPAYRYGLIQASCAPWDGATVDITLTPTPLACKRSPEGRFLRMGVWKDLPIHAGQVVKISRGTSNGFASRCRKEGDCEAVESAEITFDTYKEGSGATGSYELHFKGGDTMIGRFEVKWCDVQVMCG